MKNDVKTDEKMKFNFKYSNREMTQKLMKRRNLILNI